MKNGKTIITALALSTATALYAGGMGSGTPCGSQGQGGCAGKQVQNNCGDRGMRQGQKAAKLHGQFKQGHHNRMNRMMQRMQKQLDLTPEQQQKIQAIMAEYRQQMRSFHQKRRGQQGMGKGMGQGMQAQGMKGQGQGMGMRAQGKGMKKGMPLAAVLGAEKFDKTAFAKMMEARWAKRDARRMERRRVMLEHLSAAMEKIHGVLTPEQRKKLLELSQ